MLPASCVQICSYTILDMFFTTLLILGNKPPTEMSNWKPQDS